MVVVLVMVMVVVVVVVVVDVVVVNELNCEKKLIESVTKVRGCIAAPPTPASQYDLMKLLSSL